LRHYLELHLEVIDYQEMIPITNDEMTANDAMTINDETTFST